MSSIRITCQGAAYLPYTLLTPFQGELKTLSETNYKKLKKEILELGFSEPISVWPNEGTNYILNGHQRHRTVKQMVEVEGYECDRLPVNYIEAKDIKEAKRKVLALTSNYGKIDGQGLYQFMEEAEIPYLEVVESFDFTEINFDSFGQEFYNESPVTDGKEKSGGEELNESDFSEFDYTCPKCSFGFNLETK